MTRIAASDGVTLHSESHGSGVPVLFVHELAGSCRSFDLQVKDWQERHHCVTFNARGYPDVHFTLQFYVEDCTGCGLCVEACPAESAVESGVKAINMKPKAPLVEPGRANVTIASCAGVTSSQRSSASRTLCAYSASSMPRAIALRIRASP